MLRRRLLTIRTALTRLRQVRNRMQAQQARDDTRAWAQARRARTRRLIELGGLITKSRLLERLAPLEPDLHAALLGALLELADVLDHAPAARTRVARWRDRGRQALRAT